MAIRPEWIVPSMSARNALTTTFADVIAGDECLVQSTGSVFRAVRAGSGATVWAGVTTEQGTYTPVVSASGGLTLTGTNSGSYTRIGDRVLFSAAFPSVARSGGAGAVLFTFSLPIDGHFTDATDLDGVAGAVALAGTASTGGGASANVGEVEANLLFYATVTTAYGVSVRGSYIIREPS